MANFFSNMLGNDGIAKIAGEKVGDMVEDTVKKVMSGGEEKKEEEEGKAGGGGGFNVGDALSLVGGNKDGQGGGLDVKNTLTGLFK